MHTYLRLSATILLLVTTAAHSQGTNRLLPDSFARSLTSTWKRDGRVVDIQVTNPKDKWVVETLTFEISYKPIPTTGDPGFSVNKDGRIGPPIPKSKKSKEMLDWEAGERFIQLLPTSASSKVTIQPGATVGTHIELKPSQTGEVSELKITEARGREQTTLERIKSYVK